MLQGNPNILVVDDEKNIRKTLSYCLESEVPAVVAVADYIEKPFTSAQIKLLIRTLGHIRDLEHEITALRDDRRRFAPDSHLFVHCNSAFPTTAAIPLPGHGAVDTAFVGMERGADDFLMKPTDLSSLAEKISEVYTHRRSRSYRQR